jgi:hypothetical protein
MIWIDVSLMISREHVVGNALQQAILEANVICAKHPTSLLMIRLAHEKRLGQQCTRYARIV